MHGNFDELRNRAISTHKRGAQPLGLTAGRPWPCKPLPVPVPSIGTGRVACSHVHMHEAYSSILQFTTVA